MCLTRKGMKRCEKLKNPIQPIKAYGVFFFGKNHKDIKTFSRN